MSNAPTVSVHGKMPVRVKPESLLMMGNLKTSGTTLELALIDLRKQCDATSEWFERLEASEVEFGTPRFPDQVESTATSEIRKRLGREPSTTAKSTKEVVVAYTAVFPIVGMTSDEVLILADRLRFESANLDEPEADTAQPPVFDIGDVQSQMEAMMSQISGTHGKKDDAIRFMFRSRLSQEEEANATRQAIEMARAKAEMLANAAGLKLGPMRGVSQHGAATVDLQASAMRIHRQSMMPELSETSFGFRDTDVLSENPRPYEFVVNVHVTFDLV